MHMDYIMEQMVAFVLRGGRMLSLKSKTNEYFRHHGLFTISVATTQLLFQG